LKIPPCMARAAWNAGDEGSNIGPYGYKLEYPAACADARPARALAPGGFGDDDAALFSTAAAAAAASVSLLLEVVDGTLDDCGYEEEEEEEEEAPREEDAAASLEDGDESPFGELSESGAVPVGDGFSPL